MTFYYLTLKSWRHVHNKNRSMNSALLKKGFLGRYLPRGKSSLWGREQVFLRLHLLDRVMHWIVKTAPSSSASLRNVRRFKLWKDFTTSTSQVFSNMQSLWMSRMHGEHTIKWKRVRIEFAFAASSMTFVIIG